MPGLNFKRQFAPMIVAGKKPFTLRALRKDGRDPKIGDALYMFTDQRSRLCKKFAEKRCRFAVTIKLSWQKVVIPGIPALVWPEHLESFSKLDGFLNYWAFCKFHQITQGMTPREIRLIAWVTRDELIALLGLNSI